MMAAGPIAPRFANAPLRAPVVVADGFLPPELAAAMRGEIDAHFDAPNRHRAETHQVWNYWFVPELYTYLRTTPEKLIGRDNVQAFVRALQGWSLATLGLGNVTWPYLSLYFDGCRQNWHNDAGNGRFAFVYSLTRDERRGNGGETLIMRDGNMLRENLSRPAAGSSFFEAVAPRFNRLVVFDDRMPHAVEPVHGTMDPKEGRLVLHGHLSESGTAIAGALPAEAIVEPIAAVLRNFTAEAAAQLALCHGPLTLRLGISSAGKVERCDVLLDRVLSAERGSVEWDSLLARLLALMGAVRFPAASGETTVIQPIMFGDRPVRAISPATARTASP
jgi:hypothetical protein